MDPAPAQAAPSEEVAGQPEVVGSLAPAFHVFNAPTRPTSGSPSPFPGIVAGRPTSGSPPPFPALGGVRPHSGSPPPFSGAGGARPTSGSPPRTAVPAFPNNPSVVRPRASSGSPTPAHNSLWTGILGARGRDERPRFERDSLRNRSLEGRPGSRKNRRWTRSVEITSTLRKAMAKAGEDPNGDIDAALHEPKEHHPSAFYKLMENEGAERALEVLEAAEGAVPRSRPKQKDMAQLAEEHERKVRRTFADTWRFIQDNEPARQLLAKLEKDARRAFCPQEGDNDAATALLWMLQWQGDELATKFGTPPANEIAVAGLSPTFRKVAHQLASSLGLHSESREIGARSDKVIAMRPPRRRCGEGADRAAWEAPLSVSQVVAPAQWVEA